MPLSRNVTLLQTETEEVMKIRYSARAQCLNSLGPMLSQPAALVGSKVLSTRNTSSSVIAMSLQVHLGDINAGRV